MRNSIAQSIAERAHEAAAELTGTPNALETAASVVDINSAEFCAELDSLVFCCERCGWWCEIDEEHTDGSEQWCDDCDEE